MVVGGGHMGAFIMCAHGMVCIALLQGHARMHLGQGLHCMRRALFFVALTAGCFMRKCYTRMSLFSSVQRDGVPDRNAGNI